MLVLSGKGGVGKSTVTVQLAAGLQLAGKRVGVLDTDLCGPSIPAMLGVDTQAVHQCSEGWVPVYTDASQTLGVMSIGFLLKDKKEAVVWRGPKKTALIKQFLEDVCWGLLDYLIIDTPPGCALLCIPFCSFTSGVIACRFCLWVSFFPFSRFYFHTQRYTCI